MKGSKMYIQLEFDEINKSPECAVYANNELLYTGKVMNNINVNYETQGPVELAIEFTNKSPRDTLVDSKGIIVEDKNFTLTKITIDYYDLEELVWESKYVANDGNVYPSCLFFGPPGKFIINLENPILPWFVQKTKHKYNGDLPNWEEDYRYYHTACNLLKQI
jgi:hypothetical protein